MKLVVDVNVLVSGSLWSGNPSRLVNALLDGSATLCISGPVLIEFEEVIQKENSANCWKKVAEAHMRLFQGLGPRR